MKTTVEIKKMGINGEGIGYINRKIVFIKGALLNEEVEIDAKQYNNKNYYFGDLIRVIKPSPMRVKNPCRANIECKGCNLLHYAYPAQLKHKKDLIKESLKKYTELDRSQIKIDQIIGMNLKNGFLTQANLPIVDFKGKVTFGIYQRETKYLTVMTGCMKQHPLINQTLLQLEEVFNNHQCKTYNDKFRAGLRFIKLRVFQYKVQVIIITGKDGLKDEVVSDIKKLKQADKIHDNIMGNLFTIKALLTILEERNKENYPENYLFSIALRTEKTAMRRVNKSSILLMEIIKQMKTSFEKN